MKSQRLSTYVKGITAGAVGGIAAISFLLLFGAYPTLSKSANYNGLVKFFYDWQTFFAALIAMLAARMTISSIRHQTEAAKENAEAQRALDQLRWQEEKAAENRLAITALPHALNVIIDYAERQWRYLDRVAAAGMTNEKYFYIEPKMLPSAPIEQLSIIQPACRFPENEEIFLIIASLSRKIQYQEARLNRGSTEGINIENLTSHFETCAEIQHLATKLFEYFDQTYSQHSLEDSEILKGLRRFAIATPNSAGKLLVEERISRRNGGNLPV